MVLIGNPFSGCRLFAGAAAAPAKATLRQLDDLVGRPAASPSGFDRIIHAAG
jgi:hypothetical protein